jgi:hypothetical protein
MPSADFRKPSRVAMDLLICLSFLLFVSSTPSARGQTVGHVIGRIDGISHDGDQYFVTGWACQQGT